MTLAEAVRDAMAVLSVLKGSPADIGNAAKVWLRVMARNGVTAEELAQAADDWVERQAWFPSPSEILGAILSSREDRARLEREIGMRRLTVAQDGNGCWWASPPELVENGLYVGDVPALGAGRELPGSKLAIVSREDLEAAIERAARRLTGRGGLP